MSGPIQVQRGRSGKKWVGLNYREKERAKDANAGTMPYTLSLVTSHFPHQAEWSQEDLPDILFYIKPPTSKYVGVKVGDLIENGEPVASGEPDGHNIRDYELLPRNISLDVPGWLIEAWRRLDPRIGYQDILDRQYADPDWGFKKHTKNALQNHCRRECRKVLNTWVEYGRRDEPHRTEVESIEGLSYENIMLNTTLKRSIIFPNRLVKLRLERRVDDGLYYAMPCDVTIGNWRESTLPLDHFLLDRQPFEMTQEMRAAWEMYLILMERAEVHGFDHWSKLDRSCLPVTWYDRTRTKSVPNDTYDGGCATCTWALDRKLPESPDSKFEEEELPSTRKAGKRRRSGSRAEMWDISDTPKAPKRRYTTRISSHRLETPTRGSDCASSPAPKGVTYVETYGRTPDEYEYYNVDSESESLSNGDAEDEGSEYGGSERDEEGEEDDTTPFPYAKSDSSSPDDEEASGTVKYVETNDPFHTPSVRRISRHESYRKKEMDAGGSSSPSQHSSQAGAGAWLRRSNFLRSDSLSPGTDHSPSSSIGDATLPIADLNGVPGYLPASAFPSHRSSFTSATAQSGPSFSSNNAGVSTIASSYTEVSHAAVSNYYALPTSTAVGFPTGQFYPLPMTQSQAAFNNLSYPSPPQTATYQSQLSFMSSPPRRPEPEWEWNQERPRRHSDTDAALGLGLGLPSDFAELGAFTYGLPALSSYFADGQFGDAPELSPIVPDDQFTYSHPLESDESETGAVAASEDVESVAMVIDRTIGSYYDHELFENQGSGTMAPFPVMQV